MANSPISETVDEYLTAFFKAESDHEWMGFAEGGGVAVYMPEFDKVAVIGLLRVEEP